MFTTGNIFNFHSWWSRSAAMETERWMERAQTHAVSIYTLQTCPNATTVATPGRIWTQANLVWLGANVISSEVLRNAARYEVQVNPFPLKNQSQARTGTLRRDNEQWAALRNPAEIYRAIITVWSELCRVLLWNSDHQEKHETRKTNPDAC